MPEEDLTRSDGESNGAERARRAVRDAALRLNELATKDDLVGMAARITAAVELALRRGDDDAREWLTRESRRAVAYDSTRTHDERYTGRQLPPIAGVDRTDAVLFLLKIAKLALSIKWSAQHGDVTPSSSSQIEVVAMMVGSSAAHALAQSEAEDTREKLAAALLRKAKAKPLKPQAIVLEALVVFGLPRAVAHDWMKAREVLDWS